MSRALADIGVSYFGIVTVAFVVMFVWFPSPEYITVMLCSPGVALVKLTIAVPLITVAL